MSIKSLEQLPSAYNTTQLRGMLGKTHSIISSIEAMLLVNKDSGLFINIDNKVIAITGDCSRIMTFQHPIISKGKAYVDARAFVNKEGAIKNYYEYSFLIRRALLDLAWIENKELFYNQEGFIIDAFSSWFSYGLQRNTNADLASAYNFRMIAAIWYLGIFSNEHIKDDEDIISLIMKRIPKNIAIPPMAINDLINSNEAAILRLFRNGNLHVGKEDISLLAATLMEMTNESFHIDKGIIYNSICRGAFIANNSIEMAAISIEHPPTFIAMLTCVAQRGLQNNTSLGKTVQGISRRHSVDSFHKFIDEVAPLGHSI